MKKKLSGSGCQFKGLVAPGVLLTLSILRTKRVPEPESGVKSLEKADRRRILIWPVPMTFDETFQLLAVSPEGDDAGLAKVTTDESKVKSPWKPTKLLPPLVVESMSVVVTGSRITVEAGTVLLKLSTGRLTVIPGKEPSGTAGAGSGG